MRWEFLDPSDLAEARARQPIIEAMDRWWQAFAANADRIDHDSTPSPPQRLAG